MRRPPSQKPIEFDLGVQRLRDKEFHVRVVVRPAQLARFVTLAMQSRYGRALLGGGAVAVLTKPVAASPPATVPSAEGRSG